MHYWEPTGAVSAPAGLNKLECVSAAQFKSLKAAMERKVGCRSPLRPPPVCTPVWFWCLFCRCMPLLKDSFLTGLPAHHLSQKYAAISTDLSRAPSWEIATAPDESPSAWPALTAGTGMNAPRRMDSLCYRSALM